MHWVTYASSEDGQPRPGYVVDGYIHRWPHGETLLDVLREGPLPSLAASAMSQVATEVIPVSAARLLAPIPVPPSIRDFMSFENHVVTSMAALGSWVDPVWYQQPVFYFTNPAAVLGPTGDVPIAPGSHAFDFELEIAAVIGLRGRDIAPHEAESYIAGYTILCDWSARDLQEVEMRVGLGPAKGKDTATSIGPAIVTLDELEPHRRGNGYDLGMSVEVNGKLYSSGSWSSLYWSFPQMVAYASRGTELRPGDIIGSGTVGTGCILELARVHGTEVFPWLVVGDHVKITVEGLGVIESTIAPAEPISPI